MDVFFDQIYIGIFMIKGYSWKNLVSKVKVEQIVDFGQMSLGLVDVFVGWYVKSGKVE